MSVLAELAGLPGGPELAGQAAKVVGDPDALSRLATTWSTAAATGREQTAALRGAVGDVGAAWQGASAGAFVSYMDTATRCGDALQRAFEQGAGRLAAAAEALRTAESQATEICRNYAAAVRDFQARNPQATPEQLAQGAQPLLAHARGALDQQVSAANTALGQAAQGIRSAIGELAEPFRNLGEPDTQPFAPAPGHSLNWTPAKGDGTTLARAGAPSGGSPGFGGYGPSGPPPSGPVPQGQAADWIAEAIRILQTQGYPLDKMNPNDIWTIIRHESGGNPHAINNWDSNAAKGTPSKGLMQTIDPTFNRWKLPGHDNIYDPVDNIIAGVRYAIGRYGSVSNVPGIVGVRAGGGYRGY
ncbi:transglycosylase SLT domain-containing protein [Nonomuraea sp. NPDC000554]|uniref:transglycosylase SLT domain-containing protein n=1 Tax=Nonomuraea sp. NPDC000554 TaxID=3154259 RepID=UPI00331D2A6C